MTYPDLALASSALMRSHLVMTGVIRRASAGSRQTVQSLIFAPKYLTMYKEDKRERVLVKELVLLITALIFFNIIVVILLMVFRIRLKSKRNCV